MTDEQLALLSSITCKDVETCRIALARVGWDLNQAAQQLMSEQSSIGRCTCGKEGEGYYGQGEESPGWPETTNTNLVCVGHLDTAFCRSSFGHQGFALRW